MHLLINGWFWDQPNVGSGQYLRHLVEHLALVAPDLRITLIVPQASRRPLTADRRPPSLQPAALRCNLKLVTCPPTNLGKVWFEQILFPRLCCQLKADVALVPYWGGPLRPSMPTVVSILDVIPLLLPEYRGGPLVRLYTGLVSASAQNAARIITISESSKRDIVAHLHIPAERVHVTYLATDTSFTSHTDSSDRDHHPDLPEEYALYLGGFDVRKNIETLLQVCGWLQITFETDWPLVIAGRLPDRHDHFFRDPRMIAHRLQVEDVIRCIGPVAEEDKAALYQGARAFLFPSRYEGFGLPVLEALACGVPVVGSNASSIPEIVGDAGILVHPDDARSMAGALIAVLSDDKLHSELAQKAVAQAARFSWERCARQTVDVLRLALDVPD